MDVAMSPSQEQRDMKEETDALGGCSTEDSVTKPVGRPSIEGD